MKNKNYHYLIHSQNLAMLGLNMAFPFYLLFIKGVGTSYTQFGLAYGLFTVSSALFYLPLGKWQDRFPKHYFLMGHSFGMAFAFLWIPSISELWQVFLFQILLGCLGAVQKNSEKALLAEYTNTSNRGTMLGNYHFWTTIFSGVAIMGSGFLIDFFTIDYLFYISSVFLFGSGWLLWRIEVKQELKKDEI
jgi:MFS family permease